MRSLKKTVTGEQGVVLPAVLFVTLIACSLAATAVASAVVAQHQSTHDRNVKRAVQAANAGLDTALYRLNMLEPSDNDCVVPDGTGTLSKDSSSASMKTMSDGSSWCVPVTGELADGESYSYRVSALNAGANTRTIVSTGMVGKVQRRVAATAKQVLDAPLFKYAAVGYDSDASAHESRVNSTAKVWEDWCDDSNSNGKQPDHHCGADLATNGPLRIDNSSAVCGQAYDDNGNIDVRHGGKLNPLEHSSFVTAGDDRICPTGNLGNPSTVVPGDHSTEQCTSAGAVPITDCGDTATTNKYKWSTIDDSLPPQNYRPAIPSSNNNCALNTLAASLPCSGPTATIVRGNIATNITWDPNALTLALKSNSRVDLPGGDYVFCYLNLAGTSELHFKGPATTRIFLKPPEDCQGPGFPANGNPLGQSAPAPYETWGSVVNSGTGAAFYNDAAGGPVGYPDASTLQFFIQGSTNTTSPPDTFFYNTSGNSNEDELAAVVWAPASFVNLHFNGWMTGAVVGKYFNLDTQVRLKYNDTAQKAIIPGAFNRLKDWTECKSKTPVTPTAATAVPSNGCDPSSS